VNKLEDDYRQWLASSNQPKVRLYEATLQNPGNQTAFRFEVTRGETPVGRRTMTFASFIYSDQTNGSYQLEWHKHGKQNPEFIRVGSKPKKVLLHLTQTQDVPLPRLQIVAIEGVECPGLLVASNN